MLRDDDIILAAHLLISSKTQSFIVRTGIERGIAVDVISEQRISFDNHFQTVLMNRLHERLIIVEPGLHGLLGLNCCLTGKDIEVGVKDGAADFDGDCFYPHSSFAIQFVQHRLLFAALQDTGAGIGIGGNQLGGIIYRIGTTVPLRSNLAEIGGDITLQLAVKGLIKGGNRRIRYGSACG